jgi:hypothetical protein
MWHCKEMEVYGQVEVNPLGGLSGCGACLFSQIGDGRMVYRLEWEGEFIVTLDGVKKRGGKDEDEEEGAGHR